MAEGIELKRIVDLVAQTTVDDTVYTIIDSVSGAVKKYPLGSFICSVAPVFDGSTAYDAGSYCNYNGQLYQFDEDHAAGDWIGTDATAVTLSQIVGEHGEDISDLQTEVGTNTADITDLKSHLYDLRTNVYDGYYTIEPSFTYYKYIDIHGEVQTATSDSLGVSDYIDILPGVSLVRIVIGAFNTANQISFYNASKEYISGFCAGNSDYIDRTVEVPQNAKYFRLCNYSYVSGYDGCYVYPSYSVSMQDVTQLPTIQNKLGIYPEINEGYYYNLYTGVKTATSGWECLMINTTVYYDIGIPLHSIVLFKGNGFVRSYLVDAIPSSITDDFDAIGYNINSTSYHTGDVSYIIDSVLYDKVKKASFWGGKKANFLGDSITYGAYTPVGGSSPSERATKRYCEIACELLGIAVCRNYGASGTSISATSTIAPESAMSTRYSNMDNDADLIVVAGGTNDYGTDVVLGTIADTTDVSFYGALNVLCNGLQTKYLGKRIVFITPIHRANEGANSAGATLDQYRQAIYDVAKGVYGFAVIDGEQMGISCANSTFKGTYIYDGLHPNPPGHEVYGKALAHALNAV